MDRPVFIDIHGQAALETGKAYAEVFHRSDTACDLVDSRICPVIATLHTVYALKLRHAEDVEHLSQMIDAQVKQRSVNANLRVDEIRAEERHIIAGTALTSVAYASCMVNFTKLAFRDHFLRDTCLRIVNGADLDGQFLIVFLLCIIQNLCIGIACSHRLL